eukprot:500509-Hanusia_phi.AAC.3
MFLIPTPFYHERRLQVSSLTDSGAEDHFARCGRGLYLCVLLPHRSPQCCAPCQAQLWPATWARTSHHRSYGPLRQLCQGCLRWEGGGMTALLQAFESSVPGAAVDLNQVSTRDAAVPSVTLE